MLRLLSNFLIFEGSDEAAIAITLLRLVAPAISDVSRRLLAAVVHVQKSDV